MRPGCGQLLADLLEHRPLPLALPHAREPERAASLLAAQVRDVLEVYPDAMQVTGEHVARSEATLGKTAIQLGPGGRLAVREIRGGRAGSLPPAP